MTLVWALDLPDSQKIVLLALADSANDEGHCWPSMRSLCAKTSKSERTVQGVIKDLCEAEHLTRREVPGKGCNYTVHPRKDCTPAEIAPTPAEIAGHPRSGCGQTVIEPSKNRKSNARERACTKPDDVSAPVWRDVLALRDKLKAPLTPTALDGIRREADLAGWPLEAALSEMAARGWRGFKADWVKDSAKPGNGVPVVSVDPITQAEKTAALYRRMGRDDDAKVQEDRAARLRSSGQVQSIGSIVGGLIAPPN
jgi:Helix-turn-helix domain